MRTSLYLRTPTHKSKLKRRVTAVFSAQNLRFYNYKQVKQIKKAQQALGPRGDGSAQVYPPCPTSPKVGWLG